MNQNILINFPSRSRSLRFKQALDSIITNTAQPTNMLILVKVDENDKELKQYEAIVSSYPKQNNIRLDIGFSSNKIDAINRGINTVDMFYDFKWDILVNFSDDMVFTLKGFDKVIRAAFNKYFPEGDGFPVFKDKLRNEHPGLEKDQLCTMSVMDRLYYNRFHYVYHPDYQSLWCDNEATIVAGKLKRFVYIEFPVIFLHNHPDHVALVEIDNTYKINNSYNTADHNTFLKRQAKNFDL